jgi:hypothetical protein
VEDPAKTVQLVLETIRLEKIWLCDTFMIVSTYQKLKARNLVVCKPNLVLFSDVMLNQNHYRNFCS